MASKRKRTGSRLLGAELRQRRGERTLQDISALSKSAPFSDRVEPIGVSTLYMIEEGQTMPTLRSLQTLATVYRVPLQRLANLLTIERLGRTVPEGVRPEELRQETLAALDRADYELAWAAAERWHDVATTGRSRRAATNNKASALWKLGFVDEACQVVLDLLAEPDLGSREALVALTNLAEMFRGKGNLLQARVQADAGLSIARADGDERAQAYLLRTRANIRSDEVARERSAPDAGPAPTPRQEAILRECLDDYERSSELYRSLGLDIEPLFNDISVGQVLCALRDHGAGLRRLEAATAAFTRKAHGYGEASALIERGRALIDRGQDEPARSLLWKAERLALDGEHHDLAFNAYFLLLTLEQRVDGNTSFFLKKCQRLHPLLETRGPEVDAFESLVARESWA